MPFYYHNTPYSTLENENKMTTMTMPNPKISEKDYSDSVKKEARGNNNYDLGEVQDSGLCYVHTQRGIGMMTQFYIPKSLVRSYDGKTMYFNVNEMDAVKFETDHGYPTDDSCMYNAEVKDMPDLKNKPLSFENTSQTTNLSDIVERIPLMTQHLDVSKRVVREEAIITKIPYMETQSRDVPVMHEVITIERAPANTSTMIPEINDESTSGVYKITLEHEVVDVKKTPEIKEMLLIHKKPVTENVHVSEEIRSEKFETSDNIMSATPKEKMKEEKNREKT
jgi:uncharacterized protein (TIGR02271 family)